MDQTEVEVVTNPERLLNPAPPKVYPAKYRKYSDAEVARALIALDANGGNVFKTAKELDIPHKTLDDWAKDRRAWNPEIAKVRSGNARDLSDLMEETARTYIRHSLDPYVVGATSGRDAVFAAAIAVDKMQLLRGLPTSITENTNVESRQVLALLIQAIAPTTEAGTQDIVESHE